LQPKRVAPTPSILPFSFYLFVQRARLDVAAVAASVAAGGCHVYFICSICFAECEILIANRAVSITNRVRLLLLLMLRLLPQPGHMCVLCQAGNVWQPQRATYVYSTAISNYFCVLP